MRENKIDRDTGVVSPGALYYKTSNPFTIWYIKWLEWSSE